MVRDGIYYALSFVAAAALIAYLVNPAAAIPLLILGIFCAWFFRDPDRLLPVGPVALSPADGRVVSVVSEGERLTRISIFLNIFDVHVNRSPISGVVTDATYQKGQFLVASREDASSQNEQNIVTVRAEDGTKVVFRQIAGLIARRIVFSKKVGDFVEAGERVGLIKFGSRVDVILGPEWRIEVTPGMRVVAGTSVLATRAGEIILTPSLDAARLLDPTEEAALCRT